MEQFKELLADILIENHYEVEKSEAKKNIYSAKCFHPACPWKIQLIRRDGWLIITRYSSEHKCGKPHLGTDYSMATAEWIACKCRGKHEDSRQITPRSLMLEVSNKYNVWPTYQKCHMAKDILVAELEGNHDASFALLPPYASELSRVNPRSFLIMHRICDTPGLSGNHFQSCFWAFRPCIRTFQKTCRPLLTVDGTHLLGKYPDVLLVACTLDGNNKLLHVTYGVAENEHYQSWHWFLSLLCHHVLTCLSQSDYYLPTIISDRQKGLDTAVADVLPRTDHAFCVNHLENNLKLISKDAYLCTLLWKSAYTYRVNVYISAIEAIKIHNPETVEWLNKILGEHWSNSIFNSPKYGHVTTSVSESCNNVLKGARGMAITAVVEHTRQRMTSWYDSRRNMADRWNSYLTSYACNIVSRMQRGSAGYKIQVVDLHIHQVNYARHQDVVDLKKRHCTSGVFEDMGIPCSHAITAINHRNADVN